MDLKLDIMSLVFEEASHSGIWRSFQKCPLDRISFPFASSFFTWDNFEGADRAVTVARVKSSRRNTATSSRSRYFSYLSRSPPRFGEHLLFSLAKKLHKSCRRAVDSNEYLFVSSAAKCRLDSRCVSNAAFIKFACDTSSSPNLEQMRNY